jgi:hypothetical protein
LADTVREHPDQVAAAITRVADLLRQAQVTAAGMKAAADRATLGSG